MATHFEVEQYFVESIVNFSADNIGRSAPRYHHIPYMLGVQLKIKCHIEFL